MNASSKALKKKSLILIEVDGTRSIGWWALRNPTSSNSSIKQKYLKNHNKRLKPS